jgi:hypothetical protein
MTVPMMQIRQVRMIMGQRLVPMPVTMRLDTFVSQMIVVVMLVVHM